MTGKESGRRDLPPEIEAEFGALAGEDIDGGVFAETVAEAREELDEGFVERSYDLGPTLGDECQD